MVGPYQVFFNTGTFATSLQVTQDACISNPVAIPVTINPLPTPVITGPTSVCINNGVILHATPNYTNYSWSTGASIDSSLVIGGVDSSVFVIVTDVNGCKDSAFYTITTPGALPIPNAGNDTSIVLGNSIQLSAVNSVNAVSYHWSPGATLNDSTIAEPIATPDSTTTYVLTVFDANGCAASDTVVVIVDQTPVIVLPNGFTPNGDGQNDVFIHHSRGVDKIIEFSIFNRWGEKLFTTNDITVGWDGTYKGVAQEMGTYVYAILAIMKDTNQKSFKGNFMLIR
jgi:gliding motility-associated-like protein